MMRSERVSATDQVVNWVKSEIQSGRLRVGDKLPKEADMAEMLGVGRSSLREGMKILNTYGVVESRQGEGTFRVDHVAKNVFEFLGFLPNQENTAYFLELRRVIEVGNVIAICDQLTGEELDKLEALVRVLGEKHTIEEYIEADRAFHHRLIAYTNNPMLIQINNMISEMRSHLLYQLFCHPDIVEDAYIAHGRILQALRDRDVQACIQAVSSHIDITTDHAENLEDNP